MRDPSIGFADLMREYYDKAHLGRHALEVRADYDRAIAQIAPVLRELIVRTDSYMRIPLGGNTGRSMSIYLELAAPMNTVNVRSNQDSYYVIIGDSTAPRIDDIRHAYLHFQIDTLVASNMAEDSECVAASGSREEGAGSGSALYVRVSRHGRRIVDPGP